MVSKQLIITLQNNSRSEIAPIEKNADFWRLRGMGINSTGEGGGL